MTSQTKAAGTQQIIRDIRKEIESLRNLGDKKISRELDRLEKMLTRP